MVRDLEQILTEFYGQCLPKRKEYITFYRTFSNYVSSHITAEIDAEEYVNKQMNSEDIINSCVQYFDSSCARKESAIKKYLKAMTFVYKNCFQAKGWKNTTLEGSIPFSTLSNKVKQRIKQIPETNAPIPPISDVDFSNISMYLNEEFLKKSLVKKQFYLICNLILYFGFKFERIRDFQISDYLQDKKSLLIRCEGGVSIEARLPNQIADHLESYLCCIDHRNIYLFTNNKGNRIASSFLEYNFKPLRKKFARGESEGSYNTTGFAKFGIINLLRADLEPYFIRLITGMDHVIIDDCIKIYLQEKFWRLNDSRWLTDYFNASIGNIRCWPDV